MTQDSDATGLTIPPETKAKFGDLIDLIIGSESMNDEERQYWINILPVMTQDQVQNLRDILENEKKQLSAIDEKYAKEIAQIDEGELVRRTQEERSKRREERRKKELAAHEKEEQTEEALLKEIENA